MKKDKHSYFKEDIRRVLLLYGIVPVVLLTLVCLFLFWGAWRYSLERTNKNDNKSMTLDLETIISSYAELAEEVARQNEIFDDGLTSAKRVEIFNQIYAISNELDIKVNVYIFDNEMMPIISSKKTVPDYLDGKVYANWGVFRMLNQKKEDLALKLVKDEDIDSMQLVIGKTVISSEETLGYVVFTIDSKQFQIKIANVESQTVISDQYGTIFASNNYNFLNTLKRFDLGDHDFNGNIENIFGRYYISSRAIFENQIYIYSISSFGKQTIVLGYIFIILVFVFVMMTLTVLISTKKMAAKKTKNLYTLIEAFENAKQGDLNTYIDISSSDEWKIIGESYNLMIDSLKEQIIKNKEMGRLVATAQFKQLESQFNPHFLFNTLENIRFMCKLDPISASQMTYNLSNLLRYSVRSTQEEVTIQEDTFYTENYMRILKYRFNHRFHYDVSLSAEVERCIIPKLIIQPLIENAIKYGFEGKDKLSIRISGSIEEGKLVLLCVDDGAGMKKEVLDEVRQIIKQNTNVSNHSGLFNVHRRIQLKYGDEYGIQIESELGHGTSLRVILPVKYGDQTGGQEC